LTVVQDNALSMLFLAEAYPWPLHNGGVQRIYYLVESFAARYRLTLLTQRRGGADGAERTPLHDLGVRFLPFDNSDLLSRPEGPYGIWRPLGQRLRDLVTPGLPVNVRRWWSEALVAQLRHLRETEHFDIVWAGRAPLAEMAQHAGWSNILVDQPDLDSEAVGRALATLGIYPSLPLNKIELRRMQDYERSLPKRFPHVVVCKPEDKVFLGSPRNVTVVPNGVPGRPAVDPSRAQADEMLFVGTMGYDPNVDAVTFFMRDIMPAILRDHPPARLSIVGKETPERVQRLHDGRTCFVHGTVPEVTPYYESAGVVIAPIRLGAGTRLKVLEGLILGKAVVATTMAIEGLDLRPGIDLEVADTPDAFARACTALMRDEHRRRTLGQTGRQRALDLYQWTRIGERADEAVQQTVRPVSSMVG
jgi:polysaccharide biosynthesis protein PslH